MRSTLKCDIILLIKWGNCFMKTKIIYISGNEIFDMNDIRAAFEEVRTALNLDKTTVLFGVPVDEDDACLMPESKPQVAETETVTEDIKQEEIISAPADKEIFEETEEIIEDIVEEEPIEEEQPKKRGRPRKETIEQEESETIVEQTESEKTDEKVVPILSILSTNDETDEPADEGIDIIPEMVEEKTEEEIIAEPIEEPVEDITEESEEAEEADLEKLLSAMTPLDISEDTEAPETIEEPVEETEDISVDATLEQLATEFAETQDKIATENKSSRSKIGKLRNILPFKQSKHKDQGLGDLFGWAGVAANDEDFSVPGFFTNAASKK